MIEKQPQTTAPADRWPLQDAKAQFGELVRRARSEGPQHVTVGGRDEVVVVSAAAFHALVADRDGRALAAAMQALPHEALDLERPPHPMPVRDVVL